MNGIFKKSDIILELGGGEHPNFRPNIDVRAGPTVDIVHNLEEIPFPILTGEYDGVYSQYVLEHISWRKVPDFLAEIYRILKHDGKAVFVLPDLQAQAKLLASKDEWDFNDICMIFGDQDYSDNTHKTGFSPQMLGDVLKEVGFKKVIGSNLPQCATDMIVIAHKGFDYEESPYEFNYFSGGQGAPYDIYIDFAPHWHTVDFIRERKPESIINLGGARGYVSKHLEEYGIPTVNVDISRWAESNKVLNDHLRWDLRVLPYPFEDNQFDLAVSVSTLEHIETDYVADVIKEIIRISKRSLHGVTFEITPEDVDYTHREGTMAPRDWWINEFKFIDPDYPVEIFDKEEMEGGPGGWGDHLPPKDDLVKLNLGSFLDMYNYGWKNIDILPLHNAAQSLGCNFTQYDVSMKIREDDNSVDCIVTSHMLEHLSRPQGKHVIKEALRVLKPGGYIRIATPDLMTIANKYINGSLGDYGVFDKQVLEADDDAERFWDIALSGHKTVYDASAIIHMLKAAGFTEVYQSEFNRSKSDTIRNQTFDLHPEVSIYIEARKQGEETNDND